PWAGRGRVGTHVVVSAVEHSSVLNAAKEYAGEVTTVPVDRLGRVDAGEFTAALRPDTALACLQPATPGGGTVQPVAEVAPQCAELGVPLFVDAAQSIGWAAAPEGWSLLAASGHKWGGPPGGGGVALPRRG